MAEKQELVNSASLAELFGVTERHIQQLAKDNIIPIVKKRPYQFDPTASVQAYIKYLKDKANGREEPVDVKKAASDKLRAEADLKQSKAKIEELRLAELEGRMHRSEDVEAMTTDLVFVVRGMIMALPGRLAMDIVQANTAAEASNMIRAECYKILEALSEYKYDSEEYKKRVREREGWSDTFIEDE